MITKGNVTITKAKSKVFDVWGKRVTLKKELEFSMLKIDGETVMSETPQETGAMKEDAKRAKGRALVAGLGLGVILKYMKKCNTVYVVEPNQNVTDAYLEFKRRRPQYDMIFKMTIEDFLEVPPVAARYDFVYLDTWYGLDPEYLPHINWMYAKARNLLAPGGVVASWGYDVMVRGHVRDCLSVFDKGEQVHTAHSENVLRMSALFPLLGRFTTWLRAHPKATKREASAIALRDALSAERCPVPLNFYKDWCTIKESQVSADSFTSMIKNGKAADIRLNIGGKIWRPA